MGKKRTDDFPATAMLVFWGTPQGRVILLTGLHAIETRAASADNSKLGAYGRGVNSRVFPLKRTIFRVIKQCTYMVKFEILLL